ncbi:MAG: radical SAM protein, partial [Candidatus Thermoplasmatota archaeon]
MRIYIEPHGCALSYGEAELIEELAENNGFEIVDTPNEANLLVLHTCIVIESTERKMYTRLKFLSSYKKPLIVSGCLPSVYPDNILEISPESILVPAQQLQKFKNILETFNSSNLERSILQRKRKISAVIPIATGCLGNCSYCITKIARGALKSKELRNILECVSSALERGAKEIRLAAQDTACYGLDIGTSLPELVNKITALQYEFKLRIGMMNVNTALPILDELISCYRSEKVYKFLHLPLQSGSQRILDKMNRNYNTEDFVKVV